MEASYKDYNFIKSFDRVDEILNTSDTNFSEVNSIPSRDKLTFTNGFYVNCSALFVDIRKSSKLPTKYQRPTLARIYRSYISEVVAIINGALCCKEVIISGDSASGIFDAARTWQINEVFQVAFRINSLIRVLNYRLKKRGIDPISIGIGMSYGRALMIKAGYSGSGINEIVWMGDVVNEASKLAGFGNAEWIDKTLMVGSNFHYNLSEYNKGLLSWNSNRQCYHGEVIDTAMEQWYQENCT